MHFVNLKCQFVHTSKPFGLYFIEKDDLRPRLCYLYFIWSKSNTHNIPHTIDGNCNCSPFKIHFCEKIMLSKPHVYALNL